MLSIDTGPPDSKNSVLSTSLLSTPYFLVEEGEQIPGLQRSFTSLKVAYVYMSFFLSISDLPGNRWL